MKRAKRYGVQVLFITRHLALHQLLPSRLPIVRKIEQMNQVRFFLEHRLPAEIYDILQAKDFVVFLPAVTHENGVGHWERTHLEL